MQTPNLPIQVNSTPAAAPAARPKNGASDDGGQFSQALSREMDQHKAPMIPAPAPAQAKPAAQARAPQAPKQAEKAPAPKNAAAEPTRKPDAKAASTERQTDEVTAEAAAAAAAATPVVDMLALVASFNQPAVAAAVAAAPAEAGEAASDPLLAGSGKRAALELPADVPVKLPQAAKDLLAGQPLKAAAPLAAATAPAQAVADKAFTGIMAKTEGCGIELPKQLAPETADDGVTLERAAPLASGSERTVSSRPATESTAPNMLKAMPEQVPAASLRGRETAADPAPLKELQAAAPVTAPLQQAALGVAQAVHGVAASDRIPARVGTPAWDNQVAQKIVWMVGGAEQTASLTLNPPDLGPMQVVLSVTNDMATVTFSAAQPEVRQALEDALPKLREMMGENGIALGNASVNDGAARQQADGQPGGHGGAARRADSGAGNGSGGTNGSAAEAAAKQAARPLRAGETPGLVDTFA